MIRIVRFSLRWGGGLVAALFLVWLAGLVFRDSQAPKRFDDQLEQFVHVDNSVTRWRSEGWADTHYGAHGLQLMGSRALSSPGAKIILWGNSQVEALQIAEESRSINVFNKLMKGELLGFSVAGGGRNAADYYFLMPHYHKLSKDIVADVVQLNDWNDITPGRDRTKHSRFLASPFRFHERPEVVSPAALRWWPVIHSYALDVFYYDIYRSLLTYKYHWYRVPGKKQENAKPPFPPSSELNAAWTYLVRAMKRQSVGNLVFVYTPYRPSLERGVVDIQDPQEGRKQLFWAICEREGVGFIDLTDAFIDLYRRRLSLPRGFFNSIPGTGHLNVEGHRLIGEALAAYFQGGGAQ